MFKRKSLFFTIFFVFLLSFNGVAFAESAILKLDVESDKDSYVKDEEVQLNISVDNVSDIYQAENVNIVSEVPEEFEIISEDVHTEGNKVIWNFDKLNENEQKEVSYTVKLKDEEEPTPEDPEDPKEPEEPKDGDDPKDETPKNGEGTEKEDEDKDDVTVTVDEDNNNLKAPQTGDETNLGIYYTILIVSLALGLISIITLFVLHKKKAAKGITLLLVAALILPAASVAKAEEATTESVTNELQVNVNGEAYTFVTTVTADIIQTDIPAEDVESIKADPEQISLAPGETGQFKVFANDGTNELPINHNTDNIEYTVSDSDKVSLDVTDEQVNVIASENAQDGDEVTIDITFQAGENTHTATVTVKIGTAKGILTGKVIDASDDSPIEGATVQVLDGDQVIATITSNAEGNYETELPIGSYVVRGTHNDYLPDQEQVTIEEGETATHDVVLKLIPDNDEPGIASGFITNAETGENVADVSINVRSGKNNQDGDVVTTTTTNTFGKYEVELPAGYYTIEVSKDGYVTNYKDITVIGGEEKGDQNATITPEMNETDIRIVLTWGQLPRDLDSHLTGPTAGENRFHIYYMDRDYDDDVNDVNLDVDETWGYGPETITITKMKQDGTYTYAVHDYTNSDEEDSKEMSNSGAKVEVYKGNSKIQTFNIPTNRVGNVWRVFDLKNGEIIPVNTFDTISFDEHYDAESFPPSN